MKRASVADKVVAVTGVGAHGRGFGRPDGVGRIGLALTERGVHFGRALGVAHPGRQGRLHVGVGQGGGEEEGLALDLGRAHPMVDHEQPKWEKQDANLPVKIEGT